MLSFMSWILANSFAGIRFIDDNSNTFTYNIYYRLVLTPLMFEKAIEMQLNWHYITSDVKEIRQRFSFASNPISIPLKQCLINCNSFCLFDPKLDSHRRKGQVFQWRTQWKFNEMQTELNNRHSIDWCFDTFTQRFYSQWKHWTIFSSFATRIFQ